MKSPEDIRKARDLVRRREFQAFDAGSRFYEVWVSAMTARKALDWVLGDIDEAATGPDFQALLDLQTEKEKQNGTEPPTARP